MYYALYQLSVFVELLSAEGASLGKSIRLGWENIVYISFVGYFIGTTSCIVMTDDAMIERKNRNGTGTPR
jgi:hypothetical protein